MALGFGLGLAKGRASAAAPAQPASAPPEGPEAREPKTTGIPPGVSEFLNVVGMAGILLDAADGVTAASTEALHRGLVRNGELVHPELRDIVREVRSNRHTRRVDLELKLGWDDSATNPVEVRVTPFGAQHVLLLVEDKSEARRIDETRRDFLANVSHELKTPVGAISLLAEAVAGAHDDPKAVKRFAKRMGREANRLSLLVREIVELSRLQVQDILGDSSPVDLFDVAEEAVELSRFAAESKEIEIDFVGSPGCRVLGDRDLLVTAVRNLVDNAIAYSPRRTRVTVRTQVVDSLVEVAVTDQGQGIAPENQQRIFERFYRVDPARSRATGGTGLGLSIVKHICANHGGGVSVSSELGAGSTFTMELPVAPVEITSDPHAPEATNWQL